MTEPNDSVDMMFYSLVLSLQAAAMQHLGKVMSPVTGKVERNLEAAQGTIEMLEMIRRKTDGNLSEDEQRTLERVLYELRLNFVDEKNKPTEAAGTDQPTADESKPEAEEPGDSEGEPD